MRRSAEPACCLLLAAACALLAASTAVSCRCPRQTCIQDPWLRLSRRAARPTLGMAAENFAAVCSNGDKFSFACRPPLRTTTPCCWAALCGFTRPRRAGAFLRGTGCAPACQAGSSATRISLTGAPLARTSVGDGMMPEVRLLQRSLQGAAAAAAAGMDAHACVVLVLARRRNQPIHRRVHRFAHITAVLRLPEVPSAYGLGNRQPRACN